MKKIAMTIAAAAVLFLAPCASMRSLATTVTPAPTQSPEETAVVGQDDYGNTTVLYNDHLYTKKSKGWYIRAAYIYDGSDLDGILDAKVAGTRYTSTRYEGFLFVRMSGGWYRHELHIKEGSNLDIKLDDIAGIVSDPPKQSTAIAPTITGR